MTSAPTLGERDLVTPRADTPIAEVGRPVADTGVRHVLVGPPEHPDAIVSMRDVMAVLLGPGSPFATGVTSAAVETGP